MQLTTLIIGLLILIIGSGFFSASETAMMAINRYKLKHAAKTNSTAKIIINLLARPDRLLTIILLGNNFTNILAASISTIIGFRMYGEMGGFVASIILTIIVLLFAEISPKVVVSQKPESLAYLMAQPLRWMIIIFFPIVWLTSVFSNGLLKVMGVKNSQKVLDILTLDELRTMVKESGALLPGRHKSMLSSILDLEHISVDDIMIAKGDIESINLDDNEDVIIDKIANSKHTLLPVYRDDLDNIYGVVHMRELSSLLTTQNFSKSLLLSIIQKPYFIPEGTPLHTQLFNFQHKKQRLGLVVDEYGYIVGLVSLEDILEEIVGEFTTDITNTARIIPQTDSTYIVDGATNIRSLNSTMGWEIPATKAKTLSGAIIEYLEMIPPSHTCVLFHGYPIEIVIVQDNTIKTCKIGPKLSNEEPSV